MNTFWFLLTAIPFLTLAPKQTQVTPTPTIVKFNLYKDQTAIGTADYLFSKLKDGDQSLKITLLLGSDVKVIVNGIYNKDNVWKLKTLDATIGTKLVHLESKMVAQGAQIQVDGPSGPVLKVLEPPPNLPLADPSLTWWRGTTPKLGDKAAFAYFDLQKQTWDKETVTYIADVDKAVAGITYHTHQVSQAIGDTAPQVEYLDNQGNPVLIEGNPRFERIPKPQQ